MDRPILLTALNVAGQPGLGVHVAEASHPAGLETRVAAILAAAAAAAVPGPYIQGISLAGGGGGATWRVSLTCTSNLGWGLDTAISAAAARFVCGCARNATEIETVLGILYQRIAAAAQNPPFVWSVQVATSGRDGSCLVGILWSDGIVGQPTYEAHEAGPVGAFTGKHTMCTFTIPATLSGGPADSGYWSLHWSVAVSDPTGGGVKARLLQGAATVRAEYEQVGGATEWLPAAGVYRHGQGAGATIFSIEVESTGANNVDARHANLFALQCVTPLAES